MNKKEEYDNLLLAKEYLLEKQNRLKELEENDIVKEYIELKKLLEEEKTEPYYDVTHLTNEEIKEKITK